MQYITYRNPDNWIESTNMCNLFLRTIVFNLFLHWNGRNCMHDTEASFFVLNYGHVLLVKHQRKTSSPNISMLILACAHVKRDINCVTQLSDKIYAIN